MMEYRMRPVTVFLFCAAICVLLSSESVSAYAVRSGKTLNPVVLVPGDGGNQLEAKIDKPSTVHYICNKKSKDFFRIWINLGEMLPYIFDCWVDNVRLVYNEKTHTTSGKPGVTVRVPGFGDTSTVAWLDYHHVPGTEYLSSIVSTLLSMGYKTGVNVAGAPYDFRKAPNEQEQYFKDVKELIEKLYHENDDTKVVLVAHSMGNVYMLYFLQRQSQAWKDKYISSMFSLAGPWGGAVKPLKLFVSGDDLNIWALPTLKLRTAERTYPSNAYLMPQATFWNATEVLVSTAAKNYTMRNIEELFNDIHWPVGYSMWKDTHDLMQPSIPPGVTVHCMHGAKVDTAERFIYGNNKFPDSQPTTVYGDGDGTVNMRSLLGCSQWQGKQNQAVHHTAVPNASHLGILHDKTMLAYLEQVLRSAE